MASRSIATPLAWAFALMIAYASLYPFAGWSGSGLTLADILSAPIPRYWTWFDVIANWLGYVPLGFLVAWVLMKRIGGVPAVALAAVVCSGLSLSLEWGAKLVASPSPVQCGLATQLERWADRRCARAVVIPGSLA